MNAADIFYTVASVFMIVLMIGFAVIGVQLYRLIRTAGKVAERANRASSHLYMRYLSSEMGVLRAVGSVVRLFSKMKGGDDDEK